MFTVEINTDTPAFDDKQYRQELLRIMAGAMKHLTSPDESEIKELRLFDCNRKFVGTLKWSRGENNG